MLSDHRRWPSSSAAKKAEVDFHLIRTAQLTILTLQRLQPLTLIERQPGRTALIDLDTHLRTVSAVGPSFSATEQIASHRDPVCCSASNTIRTARSRISAGYLPGLRCSVTAPSSQGREPAHYPGGVKETGTAHLPRVLTDQRNSACATRLWL